MAEETKKYEEKIMSPFIADLTKSILEAKPKDIVFFYIFNKS